MNWATAPVYTFVVHIGTTVLISQMQFIAQYDKGFLQGSYGHIDKKTRYLRHITL